MKILIVQNTDWILRNPAQQHHLAEMMSLRGHQIRVIDFELLWRTTKKNRGLASKRQVFKNITKIHDGARITVIRPGIIKLPFIDYFSLGFSQRSEIKQQIVEFKPDIIVALGITAYISGKMAKEYNLPFVYYWIDVSHRLVPFKFLEPLGWMIERLTLKMADEVITINERLKQYVIGIGAPPTRTRVIGAGVNLKQFNPVNNGTEIRNRYGIEMDDRVLFFMGWLYKFAGLKEVVTELMLSKDEHLKLLIVGEGDAYKELEVLQATSNQKDSIILTGKRPYQEIPGLIAAADICILPAYTREQIMRDIVPIKLYEYLAMGKPVISTKLPGVMQQFGDNNGIVYVDKPGDVIEKAIELISGDNLADLRIKARTFAENNSWENITNRFEKVLEEVIARKLK